MFTSTSVPVGCWSAPLITHAKLALKRESIALDMIRDLMIDYLCARAQGYDESCLDGSKMLCCVAAWYRYVSSMVRLQLPNSIELIIIERSILFSPNISNQ